MQILIEEQIKQLVYCRKRFSAADTQRREYDKNVPAAVWQEFAESSRLLEGAEEMLRDTCGELTAEILQLRSEISTTLKKYQQTRQQMRQIESLFLMNIVRPGQKLKEAIQQRNSLQKEYQRILTTLQRAGYTSRESLQTDIFKVLDHDRYLPNVGTGEEEPDINVALEKFIAENYENIQTDDLLDALSKDDLTREFKRVVLPRIHPDTSDTPLEDFRTVFESYKHGDYLLMQAYIFEYKEKAEISQDEDVLDQLDQLLKDLNYAQRLLKRLAKRYQNLVKDMTREEKQDLNKVEENMKEQRQEILSRIQEEEEKILRWREKIKKLIEKFEDPYPSPGE